MKRHFILTLLVPGLILTGSAVNAAPKPAVRPAYISPLAFIAPVADPNPANPRSGRVIFRTVAGRFVPLSYTSRCWNLQRSPDGRSYAWIEGDRVRLEGDAQTLFPTRIVVWRYGASRNVRGIVLRPTKTYEVDFHWSDANHIESASQGRHGATYIQTFDVRSGRVTAQRLGE